MYYHADALDGLRKSFPSAAYVANASGDGTPLLSKSSADASSCYMLVFFSDNAPEIGQLNSFFAPGKVRLATVSLNAALYYYSTNDAMLHSRPFRAVAAFYDLKKKEVLAADRRPARPALAAALTLRRRCGQPRPPSVTCRSQRPAWRAAPVIFRMSAGY
jgi:hypothetical protein